MFLITFEDVAALTNSNPDDSIGFAARGNVFIEKGDWDKAIADYTKAIAIDPTQLIAFRECAASVAHKNDLKGSLNYLDKGLQLDPENKYLLEHEFHGHPKPTNSALSSS